MPSIHLQQTVSYSTEIIQLNSTVVGEAERLTNRIKFYDIFKDCFSFL